MALLLTGALALLFAMAVGRRLPLTWGLTGSRLVPRPGWLPAGREPLRREVARLCLEPTLVVSSLHTRQSQVLGLRQGTLRPELLMQERDRDPLGALIAASYLERQHDPGHQNGLTSLRLCPALRSALENLWLPAGRPLIRAGTTAMTRRSSP